MRFLIALALCSCVHLVPAREWHSEQELVTLGQRLFAERCAGCHGADGEGGARAPKLVGEGAALWPAPLESAELERLQRFVLDEMPADDPGTLTELEARSVLSYLLSLNGEGGLDPSPTAPFDG